MNNNNPKKDCRLAYTLNESLNVFEIEKAKRNFRDYLKYAWRIVEPDTEFKPNWHIDIISEYLQECSDRNIKRLIINIPPRYMKSLLVSVMFPTWEWIRNPSERFLFSSYAQALATEHSVKRRRIMQNDFYMKYFAQFQFTTDQNVKTSYENDKQGKMTSTSVGGSITGLGGNILIMDDPHNPLQAESEIQRESAIDYFSKTFSTRLNDKKTGVIIIVMQRLHEKDLTGYLLEHGGWEHLKIQGIQETTKTFFLPLSNIEIERRPNNILWEAREGTKELIQIKSDLGSYGFAGQYQQEPSPIAGGLFKKIYWNFYQIPPSAFDLAAQSWDLAFKDKASSDYVCGLILKRARTNYYLTDYIFQKMGFLDSLEAIIRLTNRDKTVITKLIEDKANGSAIIEVLRQKIPGIITVNPEGGKLARAQAILPLIEAGHVYLPCVNDPSEWNNTSMETRTLLMYDKIIKPDYISEFINYFALFPYAKYDDCVDALTQALFYMNMRQTHYDLISQFQIGKKLINDYD